MNLDTVTPADARRGARYIFLSASCFAVVSLAVKSLSHLPSEILVFWRSVICLVFTSAYLSAQGISFWGQNRRLLAMRGLAGTVALSSFFYTLHALPLATAVTVQYTSPVFTVLLAGLLFEERVSALHWICALLGFLGVWLIQGFDPRVNVVDVAIGLTGALASALAYNSVRSLRKTENEWVVMFYFQLTATILILPWTIRNWVWPRASAVDWSLIAVIGILTQMAQLFLTRGFQSGRASQVAAVNYVGVLYAIVFGVFLFHESLSLPTIAGIVIILASVLVATLARDH